MENLKLFLSPMIGLPGCTCYVERREDGTIAVSEPGDCAIFEKTHKPAIERATERLERITREGK